MCARIRTIYRSWTKDGWISLTLCNSICLLKRTSSAIDVKIDGKHPFRFVLDLRLTVKNTDEIEMHFLFHTVRIFLVRKSSYGRLAELFFSMSFRIFFHAHHYFTTIGAAFQLIIIKWMLQNCLFFFCFREEIASAIREICGKVQSQTPKQSYSLVFIFHSRPADERAEWIMSALKLIFSVVICMHFLLLAFVAQQMCINLIYCTTSKHSDVLYIWNDVSFLPWK